MTKNICDSTKTKLYLIIIQLKDVGVCDIKYETDVWFTFGYQVP